MKTGLKIAAIAAGFMLFLWGLNGIYHLLSAPDSFKFALGLGGVLVLFVLAAGAFKYTFTRKIWAFAVILIAAQFTTACGMTRVEPGHVGLKIHYAGTYRGVDDIPQVTGWVFYFPPTTKVFEYPVFVQTAVWTMSSEEGNARNEQTCFNSKEGLVVCGDISFSYQLDAAKVPHFYIKFRSDDLNVFTHGFLRNVARDAFQEIGAKYAVDEIYGPKKEEMMVAIRERINSQVKELGVDIQQFGFIGSLRLPEGVVAALNAKIKATQDAIRVENEVRQAEAEAKKAVAEARGRAEANDLLSRSISPALIQWLAIQKWDGTVPQVMGGSGAIPFINLGNLGGGTHTSQMTPPREGEVPSVAEIARQLGEAKKKGKR